MIRRVFLYEEKSFKFCFGSGFDGGNCGNASLLDQDVDKFAL